MRSTKRHCTARCRNAEAQAARRDRLAPSAPMLVAPVAVRAECPICGRPFFRTARRGGTPAVYDRRVCKRIAEKIALLSADMGSAAYR